MFRKHLVSALLLFLAACAAPRPAVTIKDDEFSREVEILGMPDDVIVFSGTFRKWRLRSWVDKQTHQVTHQLYVFTIIDGEYQYFRSAADDTARSLPVTVIDRSADCPRYDCAHYETIGVAIDDATLHARADSGIRFKISGRRGEELILPLSPTQIGLQLAAIDRLIQPPAPAAPAPPPAK